MPTYTYPYVRLTMYGTILTNQTWSCNLKLSPTTGGFGSSDLATWLSAIAANSLSTWWNATNGPWTANDAAVSYVGNRAGYYPAGSHTATASADLPHGSPGTGAGTGYMPTQTCAVASLLTNSSGRHYRGRIYVPAIGGGLASTHKLSNSLASGIANATAAWITYLNGTTIASQAVKVIVGGSVGSPAFVTKVRVDNELDIQRRRADKIAASFQQTTNV